MVTDGRALQQLQFGTRIDQMLGDTEYNPIFDNKDLRYSVRALDWGGGTYSVEQWMTGSIGIYNVNNPHKLRIRPFFIQSWRGSGATPSSDNESFNLGVFANTKGGAYFEFRHWDDAINDPCVGTTYLVIYPNYGSDDAFVWIKDANFILGEKSTIDPTSGYATISWDDTNKKLDARDSNNTTYALGYTDRGDPSAYDYDESDFTADGAWHDLDLSSIVPAGAKAVVLYGEIDGTIKGSTLEFRKNGVTNGIVHGSIDIPGANTETHSDVIVALDSNRVIEYERSSSGITSINLVVKGWFI